MFYTHKICNKRKHINVSYKIFNPTIIMKNIIYLLWKNYGNLYDCNLLFDKTNKINYCIKFQKLNQKSRIILIYYSKSSFSVPFSSTSEPEKPNQPELKSQGCE